MLIRKGTILLSILVVSALSAAEVSREQVAAALQNASNERPSLIMNTAQ